MKRLAGLMVLAALAGCTTTPGQQRPVAAPPAPRALAAAGLDRVLGQDARALQTLFGAPDLDVREASARKLQYVGPICVLDAYLYAPARGGEPTVRHLDARAPNGDDFDQASCIAALSRRREAR